MFTISVFAALLHTIYWYRDIYNNRDILDDNYRRLKFSISPITSLLSQVVFCQPCKTTTVFSNIFKPLIECTVCFEPNLWCPFC